MRTILLLALLAGGGPTALAQAGRTWVDPPAAPSQEAPLSLPQPAEPPAAAAPVQAAPRAMPEPAPPAPAPPPTRSAKPADPAPAPTDEPPRQSAQPSQVPPPAQPAPPAAAQMRDPDEEIRAARAATARRFAVEYLNSWSAPNESALEATQEFYAPRVLYHSRELSLRALINIKRRFVRRWPERDYRARPDSMGVVCNPTGDVCTVHVVFDYRAADPRRGRQSQGTGALQLIVHFLGERPIIVAEHSTVFGQDRRRNLALEASDD